MSPPDKKIIIANFYPVWPAMGGLFLGLCGARLAGALFLALGVALLVVATVEYARSARAQLAARGS